MALLFALALIAALRYQAPTWLLISLFVVVAIFVGALLIAYFYCLFSGKDKLIEALRTENYSIQKLAIEKGFRGDSSTGIVIGHEEHESALVVQTPVTKTGGENQ